MATPDLRTAADRADDPYRSRRSNREEITDRIDPVVWGNRRGPLHRRQLAQFERRGFLVLDDVLDLAETAELREAAQRTAAKHAREQRESLIREPDGDQIRSLFNPHLCCSEYAELAGDPRLLDPVRQILGDEVYVHQFRINFKPGFAGREFSWHSDFETWHIEDGMPRMRAISTVVMLDENDAGNGPLLFIPTSHRRYVRCAGETPDDHYRSSLRRQEYGVPSRQALAELAKADGVTSATGKPGTVVLFDCNLLHASTSNFSPRPRTNAFVVFNSCTNRLVEPFGSKSTRPDFLGNRKRPAR